MGGRFGRVVDGFSLVLLSGGGEGGEEETPGHVLLSRFHRTTRVSEQPFLCYLVYIEQWGFRFRICQTIENDLRSSMTWAAYTVQVGTTRRPLPHTKDSEGSAAPRSTTDSTEQWVWCIMYMSLCYMLFLLYV